METKQRTRRNFIRASIKDTIAISEKFKSVLTKTHNGCSYIDDWSDTKVADYINDLLHKEDPDRCLNANHIGYVRMDLYGSLVSKEPSKVSPEQFSKLQGNINSLIKEVTELRQVVIAQDHKILTLREELTQLMRRLGEVPSCESKQTKQASNTQRINPSQGTLHM